MKSLLLISAFFFSLGSGLTDNKKFPIVNDNFPKADKAFLVDEMRYSWTTMETVSSLDSPYVFSKEEIKPESYYEFDILADAALNPLRNKRELKLYVDTGQTASIKELTSHKFPAPLSEGDKDRNKKTSPQEYVYKYDTAYYKGYPVFIVNETNEKQMLELEDGRIMMIQEAKDDEGNWIPIEAWLYSDCGNSYYSIVLQPRQFGFTRIPQYEGDFETELRVKMQNGSGFIYSNTFSGSINKAQFAKAEDMAKISPELLFNR